MNRILVHLTQKASSVNNVIDDVIIWKWRHHHDYLWPLMSSTDPMWPHNDRIMAEKILEYWFCEKIEKKIFFWKNENFQNGGTAVYQPISTQFFDIIRKKGSSFICAHREGCGRMRQVRNHPFFSKKVIFNQNLWFFTNCFDSNRRAFKFRHIPGSFINVYKMYKSLKNPTKLNLYIHLMLN